MSEFKEYPTKVHPYSRGVSIIGTGCTPFKHTLNNPGWEGITESELLATAGIAAMDDAGINGKDIDALVQGQVFPHMGGIMNGNVHVMDWLGMRGKASVHLESACTTSALVIDTAVMMVASGKYDVVMAAGVDMAFSVPEDDNKPNCYRRPSTSEEFAKNLVRWSDPAYARHIGPGSMYMAEDFVEFYMKKYNVSAEEIDDAFIGMAIAGRRNSALEPNALFQTEYKDLAAQAGYDDVIKYMKSRHNPKISRYLRRSGFYSTTEGAGAVIVCATDIAKKISKAKPIEVLGFGHAALDHRHQQVLYRCSMEAARQAYEMSGVSPDQIELFLTPDFTAQEQLLAAEASGYLPEGEGWKYFRDQRTAYDGDKPLNTDGGCTNFGHVFGASTLSKMHEAVHQMRGECGARQVKKQPKYAAVRGQGGAQSMTLTILKAMD